MFFTDPIWMRCKSSRYWVIERPRESAHSDISSFSASVIRNVSRSVFAPMYARSIANSLHGVQAGGAEGGGADLEQLVAGGGVECHGEIFQRQKMTGSLTGAPKLVSR